MSEPFIQVHKDERWFEGGWSQIPNGLIRDRALTAEARLLMIYMASHSPSFQVSVSHLMAACGVGKDKLRRMMRELIDAGYLEREQTADPETGRLGLNSYVLHPCRSGPSTDLPSTGEPSPVNKTPFKKTNVKKNNPSGVVSELALTDNDGSLFLVQAEAVEITAQAVTAAWIDEVRKNGVEPSKAQIGRVARTAKELLAGNDGSRVLDAARHAGQHGNAAVDSALTILNGKPFEPPKRPARGRTSVYTSASGLQIER